MRILLTRPIDQADMTAERLRAAGHEVLFAPMLRIEPLEPPAFRTDDISAIAVTSARVAEALRGRPECDGLRMRPVFAVGSRTADAMASAGFARVETAAGDAAALAAGITRALAGGAGAILYPCGRERRGDLDARLRDAGFAVRLVELYGAQKQETLPNEVRDALKAVRVDAVLIYSRRTAEAFVRALQSAGIDPASVRTIAISETAAEPLVAAGCSTDIARTPDEAGLLARLR
ncbi:uroporphyrinogen-III synthase [Breoghania corrubedonensis]|uniref:Uroporphyrinogen-III synthase n=1 Tax=Breoghania corrubedonensis TaxID=665038 RepID=A0A2T5VHX5_9HYPH|nr:uroporphyrinogen-III synthase [Breoghania corrubedonensis]PTW63362.1 uroporphyrinogen-III synthase [Breoghania corrubedonensis]